VDPYLAAAMTFANSALGGAGTVMVHYTRARKAMTDLPTEAAEVCARAARDVGIRAGFAVSMKDRKSAGLRRLRKPCSPRFPQRARAPQNRAATHAQAPCRRPTTSNSSTTFAAAGGRTGISMSSMGPNGVQWCSDELLQAVAEASQRTGPPRPHASLGKPNTSGNGPMPLIPGVVVRMLDEIGPLVAALDARPLRVGRGRKNSSYLPSVASSFPSIPAPTFISTPALPPRDQDEDMWLFPLRLGIDSKALDDDDDALRELRLS